MAAAAARPARPRVRVEGESVRYDDEHHTIEAACRYVRSEVVTDPVTGDFVVRPSPMHFALRTDTRVPRMGVMLVGWGGNNGSTLSAAIVANRERMSWRTRTGVVEANWLGSITQSSTVRIGVSPDAHEVFAPFSSLLPMVHPNDLVVGGWDISTASIYDAVRRAQVLDVALQDQLRPHLEGLRPLPAVYLPDFIAANQADRADNVLRGTLPELVAHLRADIRGFKAAHGLDVVTVLWTANTERFADFTPGVHDTAANVLAAIERGHPEISPSMLYAVAALEEGCAYINGSPQNTLVPGIVELAKARGTYVAGDDFKSGQTKFKSVLVDYLVGAGLRVKSIVSYNHLGNNDGKNLSEAKQFRSKEISKSGVVEDMVDSNPILYPAGTKPDHVVVIKYVPTVGDSKRALDEYTSEIFMGGVNTIVTHNTCEDSLLAVPLIVDLVVLTELFSRIRIHSGASPDAASAAASAAAAAAAAAPAAAAAEGDASPTTARVRDGSWHTVLSVLSYLLKAPCVPAGTPLVNALFRQKQCIENILRAAIGLPPDDNMLLEYKLPGCDRAPRR